MSATRGIGMPVDVGAIDRELAELWRSAADAHASGELSPVVRACLVNLIVWAPLERDAEPLRDLAARLSLLVPARVVHVRAERGAGSGSGAPAAEDADAGGAGDATDPGDGGDPGAASGIRAWISANCHLAPEGGKEICSEEVTIAARGRAVDEAPSVVLTLLSPDVPTALLVTGPLPARAADEPALAKIARACDRLIVDSGRACGGEVRAGDAAAGYAAAVAPDGSARSAGTSYFDRLASLARALPARGTLGDLAWRRLSPWRRAIADEFDGAFAGRAADIESAAVEFAEPDAASDAAGVPARLLLGWIASVLAWGGDALAARGVARVAGAGYGAGIAGVPAVELQFRGPAPRRLRIEVVGDARENVFRVRADDAPPRVARHPRIDEEHLLARELRLLHGDRVYQDALALASRIPDVRA